MARTTDDAAHSGTTPPIAPALGHAARHYEVTTGDRVDAVALGAAFRTGEANGEVLTAALFHVQEADPAEIADLIVEGSATVAGLRRLTEGRLRRDHRTRTYLERFRR